MVGTSAWWFFLHGGVHRSPHGQLSAVVALWCVQPCSKSSRLLACLPLLVAWSGLFSCASHRPQVGINTALLTAVT